jgi:hypothetical protein
MMNLQYIDYPFFATMGVLILLTLCKDLYNTKADKITNWEEFDKKSDDDILTEDERGFLEKYRCNTMDISELLHDFVCSGKFGEYSSNYEEDYDEEEIASMVIYKKENVL